MTSYVYEKDRAKSRVNWFDLVNSTFLPSDIIRMWRNHQSILSSRQYQKRQQDVQKDRQRGRSEREGESSAVFTRPTHRLCEQTLAQAVR